MPKCRKCLKEKEQHLFYRNLSYVSGFTTSCKECDKQIQKKYRDPVKRAVKKFNISKEVAEILVQTTECAICGATPKRNKLLCIDHNHTTGKVRGALCDACNKGIGLFKDNCDLLKNAIKYLEKHSECI